MAKKVRGHRANKANDSFGTINNDSLYRGKYREDVYKDEDEEETVEAQEADPQEATPQEEANSFVEAKKEETHDYKKRYDDLKRHYDEKVGEFKTEIETLRKTMTQHAQEMPRGVTPPKTAEELEEFKERYPDVFEVVQTVSSLQTESQVAQLREELGSIKEREQELEKQKAFEELLRLNPISTISRRTKSSLLGSKNNRLLSLTASTKTTRMLVGRHESWTSTRPMLA